MLNSELVTIGIVMIRTIAGPIDIRKTAIVPIAIAVRADTMTTMTVDQTGGGTRTDRAGDGVDHNLHALRKSRVVIVAGTRAVRGGASTETIRPRGTIATVALHKGERKLVAMIAPTIAVVTNQTDTAAIGTIAPSIAARMTSTSALQSWQRCQARQKSLKPVAVSAWHSLALAKLMNGLVRPSNAIGTAASATIAARPTSARCSFRPARCANRTRTLLFPLRPDLGKYHQQEDRGRRLGSSECDTLHCLSERMEWKYTTSWPDATCHDDTRTAETALTSDLVVLASFQK